MISTGEAKLLRKELYFDDPIFKKTKDKNSLDAESEGNWFDHSIPVDKGDRVGEKNFYQNVFSKAVAENVFHSPGSKRRFLDVYNKASIGHSCRPDAVIVEEGIDESDPHRVKFILDVKDPVNIDSIETAKQLFKYARVMFQDRKEVDTFYCFSCDTSHLVVFKFNRDHPEFYVSEKMECRKYSSFGAALLRDLLHIDLESVGQPNLDRYTPTLKRVEPLPRYYDYDICEKLGSGTYGTVYAAGPDNVLKVYHGEEKLTNCTFEADTIKRVRELIGTDQLPHMPQVVETFEDALLLSPQGQRLGGSTKEFALLVPFLQALHEKAGMVHRDIRPCNIVYVLGRYVLIDWGCAINISDYDLMKGTLTTIPDELYGCIVEPVPELYKVEPRHDLESLVKSLFLIFLNEDIRTAEKDPPKSEIKELIENFWGEMTKNNLYNDMMKSARSCDYNGLRKLIEVQVLEDKRRVKKW